MSGIRGLFLLEVSCCSEWVFEVIGREILSSETLFPGRLRQCSQNTSKSSVRPPIFQGPNGCTPARFLSGCGPEVVQKSASRRSFVLLQAPFLDSFRLAEYPDRTCAVSAVGIVFSKPKHAGCRIPAHYAHSMPWS